MLSNKLWSRLCGASFEIECPTYIWNFQRIYPKRTLNFPDSFWWNYYRLTQKKSRKLWEEFVNNVKLSEIFGLEQVLKTFSIENLTNNS